MHDGNGYDGRRVAHEVTRRIVNLPTPPAGLGFTHTVPGAVSQQIMVVSFALTCAAGGSPRIPTLLYVGPDGIKFGAFASNFTLAATNTATFTFAVGINEFGANNAASIGVPLPPLELDVGESVTLNVTNGAAGDQIVDPRLFVVQRATWPDVERPAVDPETAMGDWRYTAR